MRRIAALSALLITAHFPLALAAEAPEFTADPSVIQAVPNAPVSEGADEPSDQDAVEGTVDALEAAADEADAGAIDAVEDTAVAPVTALTWRGNANTYYFDSTVHLRWRKTMGDWSPEIIGSALVTDTDEYKKVRFNVTGNDFVLRSDGRGSAYYYTRNSSYSSRRPYLLVNGKTKYYPSRDTWLTGSYTPQGEHYAMRDSGTMLIAFDKYVPKPGDRAELVLTTYKQYGTHTVTVHRPDIRPALPAIPFTAVDSTVVRNIDGSDFASSAYRRFSGDIATSWWEGTRLTAFDVRYRLPPADEYYLTVVMKLHDDFTDQGGKLPGLANTGVTSPAPRDIGGVNCGDAGWGGTLANGCRWSARSGWWGRSGDRIGIGAYFYAVAPANEHGVTRYFPEPVYAGRWFAYVQRVRVNTVGESDGLLSYWLCAEGACAPQLHVSDIKWREADLDEAKVTEIWANVFCGGDECGTAPWPRSTTSIRRLTATRGLPDLVALEAEVADLNDKDKD